MAVWPSLGARPLALGARAPKPRTCLAPGQPNWLPAKVDLAAADPGSGGAGGREEGVMFWRLSMLPTMAPQGEPITALETERVSLAELPGAAAPTGRDRHPDGRPARR